MYLTLDGQIGFQLQAAGPRDDHEVDESRVALVRPPPKTYFEVLRSKLQVGRTLSRRLADGLLIYLENDEGAIVGWMLPAGERVGFFQNPVGDSRRPVSSVIFGDHFRDATVAKEISVAILRVADAVGIETRQCLLDRECNSAHRKWLLQKFPAEIRPEQIFSQRPP